VTVFERLIAMTTVEGNLVFDPMCGSGTTAVAARKLGRLAIVTDHCEDYIRIVEQRLNLHRISLDDAQGSYNGLPHGLVTEPTNPFSTQNGVSEQHVDQLKFDWEQRK
jgi:hypothetical protein